MVMLMLIFRLATYKFGFTKVYLVATLCFLAIDPPLAKTTIAH